MALSAWATSTDLFARYPALSDVGTTRADTLLLDATAKINQALSAANIDFSAPTDTQAQNYESVCCAMVNRALVTELRDGSPFDIPGASQASRTTGPFNEQVSFTNPLGDLYLTQAERRALGLRKIVLHSILPEQLDATS